MESGKWQCTNAPRYLVVAQDRSSWAPRPDVRKLVCSDEAEESSVYLRAEEADDSTFANRGNACPLQGM